MLEVIKLLVGYIQETPGVTQAKVLDSWQDARNKGLKVDKQCGVLFEEIVEIAVRGNFSLEYGILEVLIHIGHVVNQRGFISEHWWFKLVEIKVPRKSEGMRGLVGALLNYGISRDNVYNWKAIMLLLELFYQQSDIRRYIIEQLRDVYNYRLGEILDSLNSFQLANYLIELIINCFPKKHNSRATLSAAPQLWSDAEKTKSFFSDELYPHRVKHGDDAIIQFILKRYSSFFTNFGTVKKALYITGKSSGVKTLAKYQSYLQVLHQSLFFWDGEGLFCEMDPRKVSIARDLTDTLKVTLNDDFAKCVFSPHSAWLMTLSKATSFQFQTGDPAASEMIWHSTKLPKISEVQTYISLRFPSSFEDEIIESSMQDAESTKLPEVMKSKEVVKLSPTGSDPESTDSSFLMGQVTNNFDTPNNTHGSTVEKNLSSAGDVGSSSEQPETPRKIKLSILDDSIQHDEQSPLALAQKRKIIRATSNSLGLLKKGVKSGAPIQMAMDKKELSHEAVVRKDKDLSSSKNGITDMFKSKPKNSKPQDASVLDDIFALPLPRGSNKKAKLDKTGKQRPHQHQTVLKNLKHIVFVQSQEASPNKSKQMTTVKRKRVEDKEIVEKRRRSASEEDNFSLSELEEHPAIKPGKTPSNSDCANKENAPSTPTERITRSKYQKNSAKVPQLETPNQRDKSSPSVTNTASDTTLHNEASSHTDISMITAPSRQKMPSTTEHPPKQAPFATSFTNQLQEQIYHSVMNFSNELTRKISLINGEMNQKIVNELSEKYTVMFKQLQASFQNDVEKITGFVGEIKDMLHLPEEELLRLIREKQFNP